MSWLETLFLADVLSSDKKTAQKKIRAFVWVFFGLIGFFLVATFLMMALVLNGPCPEDEVCESKIVRSDPVREVIAPRALSQKETQNLKNIFIEHIAPKTLQDGTKTENMDKAISEEIALLKEKQNPLANVLVSIQQNYQDFLANNGKPCEIKKKGMGKGKINGILEMENPYHASIQSMIDIAFMGKNVEIILPLEKSYVCVGEIK